MDAFPEAFALLLGVEGKYSNNPADPGGATMWGITERVARRFGYAGDMRELPLALAQRIYREQYWQPLRLDDVALLSRRLANELFDTNVNFYTGAAASFLQRSLRCLGYTLVAPDNLIGPATLEALASYLKLRAADGEAVLLRCLNGLQLSDYVRQVEASPAKAAFFYGWVRARVV